MKIRQFNIIPRYTAGSPGLVDEALCRRIAREEMSAREMYLESGDPEWVERANREGLEGIAIIGDGKGHYTDVITGRDYGDVPYGSIRHPNDLLWTEKGREALYYYKRQLLIRLPKTKSPDDNHWSVVIALRDKHGLDPTGLEVEKLWRSRRWFSY